MTRRVAITGVGVIGPFGSGASLWIDAVKTGRSALGREAGVCGARLAEEPDGSPFPANAWRRLDRGSRMAVATAREALLDAGLPAGAAREETDIGLVAGTMTGGVESLAAFLKDRFEGGPDAASPMLFPFTVPNAPASQCSILLGLRGPNLTLSAMEASGLAAIVTATELVRSGAAEIALAGGVDERVAEFDRAWTRLRLLHRGGPEEFAGPFGRRRGGFAPGEGAAFVVLEEAGHAAARGAKALAEVAGTGHAHAPVSSWAWPDAASAAAAIRQALDAAGTTAGDLGCALAAANGSKTLDAVDAESLHLAFGKAARRVPVTSVKGAWGESGSAAVASVVAAVASIRDGFVPPIACLRDPDPDLGLDLVMGEARLRPVASVLVEAAGTGGSCAAVVLTRPRL